jgi:hypothetical protein
MSTPSGQYDAADTDAAAEVPILSKACWSHACHVTTALDHPGPYYSACYCIHSLMRRHMVQAARGRILGHS